jgi:hypothetical protein
MSRLSQFPSPQDLPSILRLASDIPNEGDCIIRSSPLLERSRRVRQDVCTAKQFVLVESIGFYAACVIDWDAGGVYVDRASNTIWDDALLDAERCFAGMAYLERAHRREGRLAVLCKTETAKRSNCFPD